MVDPEFGIGEHDPTQVEGVSSFNLANITAHLDGSVEIADYEIVSGLYKELGLHDLIKRFVRHSVSKAEVDDEDTVDVRDIYDGLIVQYCELILPYAGGDIDTTFVRSAIAVVVGDINGIANEVLGPQEVAADDSAEVPDPVPTLTEYTPDSQYFTHENIWERFHKGYNPHRNAGESDRQYVPRFLKQTINQVAYWPLLHLLEEKNTAANPQQPGLET